MLRIQCLTIDCADPQALAPFWRDALEWVVTYEDHNEVALESPVNDGSVPFPDLLFIRVPDSKLTKNRLHLDLRPADQAAEVARLEALGARRVSIGQENDPHTTWVVMEDPAGNEFCVLRALPIEADTTA